MGYIPGLDGIRAIAVMAVLLYHAGVAWIPGGFLGVDVFFVLSGFLISTLLLQELAKTNAISFKQFYIRRARRLLPALFLTLALSAVLVLLFAHDAAAQFRQDAVGALFYVANWSFIFSDVSYFEAMGRPPMLQHLWSLAVEEQFYLLWPVALFFLYRWRGRSGVGRVALSAALFSTLLMAVLSLLWNAPGEVDASRLYFGTDTHCMGLLLGAALATVWRPGGLPKKVAGPARAVLMAIAVGALLVLFMTFHRITEDSAFLYRGGFLIVAGVTAVIVALACHPAIPFGRLLAVQPMKYLGERSYGLYLYHWPIFVVTRPGIDLPFEGWPAVFVQIGLTVIVAELSYRYVEVPIRRGALMRTWRKWREQGMRPALVRTAGLAAATGAAVVATAAAVAAIPAPNASDYLGGVTSTGDQLIKEPGSDKADEGSTQAATDPNVPIDYSKRRITGVGDSVMLGARSALEDKFKITVDAAVSRQFPDVAARIMQRKEAGALADVVVIHTGTNGTAYWDGLMDLLKDLEDRELVVLVTVHTPNTWMDDSNRNIRSVAKRFPNVRIADWEKVSDDHREYFVYDGTHLTGDGMKAYAKVIDEALQGTSGDPVAGADTGTAEGSGPATEPSSEPLLLAPAN